MPIPTTFPATVEVDEFETGVTRDGDDYIALRDATVETRYETVQRTVMAFGTQSRRIADDLAQGRPIEVNLYESGPIMKVAEAA